MARCTSSSAWLLLSPISLRKTLPSAAHPFCCLTHGKIQSVFSCSSVTKFAQENIFHTSVSRRKEFWDEGWRGATKQGKRRSGVRNYTWPFLGLPPVITYIAAGVSWFVQLWLQHVKNEFLGKYCLSHAL